MAQIRAGVQIFRFGPGWSPNFSDLDRAGVQIFRFGRVFLFPRSAVTLIHKSAGVQIFRFGNGLRWSPNLQIWERCGSPTGKTLATFPKLKIWTPGYVPKAKDLDSRIILKILSKLNTKKLVYKDDRRVWKREKEQPESLHNYPAKKIK